MKDGKLSIDILIIFSYTISLGLICMDIYTIYLEFLLDLGLSKPFINKGLIYFYNMAHLFQYSFFTRMISLMLFAFASFGYHVKKKPESSNDSHIYIAVFIVSLLCFVLIGQFKTPFAVHVTVTLVSFLSFIWSYIFLRRHLNYFGSKDEFNEKNLNFKQERKVKNNPYSVNLKTDKGVINVVNPFRGTMVLGTPGSGKSYSVIEEFIRQHIQKQFSMVVYDFKFPSLAKETYGFYQFYKSKYKVEPNFSVISLDDIEKSNFVNPISPHLIRKASDAIEASQTVLYNLNKEWITRRDFFAQSAISYFAACIYFLKIYEDGKYCTLPHAITLASCSDEDIFTIFTNYKELKFFLSPFADALQKQAFEQLAGQTASARIPLSQLATKELFWVMGNNVYPELNIPLDINNPDEPTILILANSPKTQTTNSPALGLISTQLLKEINAQHKQPCSVIIDELPTLYFMGLDNLIATARSNKISTTIGMQDLEQLKRDYGDKIAATIFNIVGNIFSGSVRSETASKLQEVIGKKKQKLKNVSIDTHNTSYSINENLEYAVPVGAISQLSQGEFIGMVSDNFGEEIKRKIFRGKIKVDKRKDQVKGEIPDVLNDVDIPNLLNGNFNRIVEEIDIIVSNLLYEIKENKQGEDEDHKP
ncbi:type IV secretory system conjugative DNA transfer family protein [Allomuricauda taeanensis]|uniref:type IV secretory system conjugative DNA transfer family protein n=1 Tax=Flagellimonas taeanensis TaxID=1005926 RepID=UPI002E7BE5DA|nr:type IV secretory system conjugative DNA transfer family protein [Allomuricauda taeanensis]MEE1964574.1 type IV secretory system conjugative DNA transfer family protein [Allomuricauda taeanensis]